MKTYDVMAGGEQRGPFTMGQLGSMWNAGSLPADAKVRVTGAPEWEWHALSEMLPSDVVAAPDLGRSRVRVAARVLLWTVATAAMVAGGGWTHILSGKGVGLKLVARSSFGFSEMFVNADAITNMPWIAARARYPLGCMVLQREGLVESDEAFRRRVKREVLTEQSRVIGEAEAAMRGNGR